MRESAKKRKNFLPTVLVALFFWIAWLYVFFQVPPQTAWNFLSFYLSLFLALFLTTALILANSRRGFFLSLALTSFLLLRHLGFASVLNTIFLLGSLLSLEIYFKKAEGRPKNLGG